MATYSSDPYFRNRPGYPPDLFNWLASIAPEKRVAWDAGTGTGLAAVGLATSFDTVVATDRVLPQPEFRAKHSRVTYRQAPAGSSGLNMKSVDVATAACAAHWFHLGDYYEEVRRVLVDGGIIALWTYSWPRFDAGEVDALLLKYRDEILGEFWPEGTRYYLDQYKDLPFPFADQISAPYFELTLPWDADGLLDFLDTWSGANEYRGKMHRDPSTEIRTQLVNAWLEAGLEARVVLPLHFRVARVSRRSS